MSKILAENPSIVSQKRVLELGCGSAGLCSMAAAPFAELVVATDGDPKSLLLLKENLTANLPPILLEKMIVKKLVWGSDEDMAEVSGGGFDVVIGTDVTYVAEAISPLFETARKMISGGGGGGRGSGAEVRPAALILCHVQRRVSEDSILEAASRSGFRLVDRLVNGVFSGGGIISSWFSSSSGQEDLLHGTAVNIMYFHLA